MRTRSENRSGNAGRPSIARNAGISNDSTSSGPGILLTILLVPAWSVPGGVSRLTRAPRHPAVRDEDELLIA